MKLSENLNRNCKSVSIKSKVSKKKRPSKHLFKHYFLKATNNNCNLYCGPYHDPALSVRKCPTSVHVKLAAASAPVAQDLTASL